MKRAMRAALVMCGILAMLWGQSEAQIEIKAAGGFLWDPVRWGGHLSIDIPIGDDYPTYLAPFVEVHRKKDDFGSATAIPAGVSLLYKAPFTEEFGTAFFGIGAGLYRVSASIQGIDLQGNPATLSDSSTQAMVSAAGGLHLHFTETVGGFVQARWFRAFASGSRNEISLMVGLSFRFGED